MTPCDATALWSQFAHCRPSEFRVSARCSALKLRTCLSVVVAHMSHRDSRRNCTSSPSGGRRPLRKSNSSITRMKGFPPLSYTTASTRRSAPRAENRRGSARLSTFLHETPATSCTWGNLNPVFENRRQVKPRRLAQHGRDCQQLDCLLELCGARQPN